MPLENRRDHTGLAPAFGSTPLAECGAGPACVFRKWITILLTNKGNEAIFTQPCMIGVYVECNQSKHLFKY